MDGYTILVAVDFSKGSLAALLWAIDYTDKIEADLKIVHVVHDPASAPGSYKRKQEDILKPLQEIAQEEFDQFLAKILGKRPNSTALKNSDVMMVSGLPAKRILSIAKKTGANHIVLGCLGQGKLPNVFVGSVAQKVLKKSPLPITIIKVKAKKKKSKA